MLFTATLEDVFTENRLSISYLLHGSARWGLFVCFSMTNYAPTATLRARGSVSLGCQPEDLRSILRSCRDSPICLLVMSNPGRGTLLHTAVPSLLFPRPCHCFCSLPSPVSPLLPWLHCHLSESGLSHTPPSCHLQFPVTVSVFGGSQTQMLNSLL